MLKPLQESAAQLLAEAEYDYVQISEMIGVDVATLRRWRQKPKFSERVAEIVKERASEAMQFAIANKAFRVRALQKRHRKLLSIAEERAADPSMAAIPGGKTGYVARKIVASSGELMGYEYAVDIALSKELRDIEQQVAKELGQIVDKRELTGKDGGPLQHEHSVDGMSNEQIDAELRNIFGSVIGTGSDESTGASQG